MLKTEVKQILGTPNGLAWSQVHHFFPSEKEQLKKRGELILLVSLASIAEGQEASSIGREIISRVHEEYFGNLDKSPMDSLKESLVKVGQEKSQYFENPKEISLMALVVWQEVVYLSVWYQGRILLRRQGKTVTLIKGEAGEIKAASGRLKKDDLFLLATEDFLEKIPQGMVTASLSTEDLKTIADVLTPVVHAREKQGSLAAVLVKLGPQTDEKPLPEKKKPSIDLTGIQKSLSGNKFFKKIKSIFKSKKKVPAKLPLPTKKTEMVTSISHRSKRRSSGFFASIGKKTSGLTVAIGFLILLGGSVFFGWKKKLDQQKSLQIDQLVLSIEEKIETALMIKSLDPENSLKIIKETENLVAQLKDLSFSRASAFEEKINAFSSSLGTEAVEPRLYYDLGLVAEGTSIDTVFSDGQRSLILDTSAGRLLDINLVKKSGLILSGGDQVKNKKLTVFSDQRVYLIGESSIDLLKDGQPAEAGSLLEGDRIIAADVWLGSLYLLDSAGEQVWKYPSTGSGLGLKRAWLQEETDFSFESVADISIDGNLWLLLKTGRIYKFLSGRQAEFDHQLPTGVGKARFLSAALEGETLSFWDEEKKIIWVFNKEGEFLSRIPVKIDSVKGLSLSPSGDKIFLFGKDKIYSFDLD